MSYLALYRKYRPTTFDKLVGQEHIVKTLVNQIVNDRLGHAYLFTGTRGTGKTSAAKIFAKAINCLHSVNGSPCGECDCCKALSDPSNIDILEIDAASNNGVNEIRDLREKVQYPPVSCKYKVYIIDEVHMLTGAAFNALLKTLEEPPKHAVFILATTEVHKIPATILSRCMRFDFRLVSVEKIAQLISNIYDEQGKKYDAEAVMAIAKAGEGSIRDALSIADTALSYSDGALTYNDVMEILGATNFDRLFELLSAIISGDSAKILSTIDLLSDMGKSMGVLIKDVTAAVRDLIICKTCNNCNKILNLPADKLNVYLSLAKNVDEQRLLRMLEIFADAEASLRYSTNPRIIFETAAIKAARPDADVSIEAVMSRVKQLELQLSTRNNTNSIEPNKSSAEIQNAVKTETNTIVKDDKRESEKAVSSQPITTDAEETEVISGMGEKLALADVPKTDLKGRLLFGLRKNGAELIWNVIQKVELEVKDGVLIIWTNNSGDIGILSTKLNVQRIQNAMNCLPFEVRVVQSNSSRMNDKIDEASEDVKKRFGDEFVTIK